MKVEGASIIDVTIRVLGGLWWLTVFAYLNLYGSNLIHHAEIHRDCSYGGFSGVVATKMESELKNLSGFDHVN